MTARRYRNPIIAGFYPDPSVCRVGADYYLVTSSFEYYPGVPLFHSRDLVHWEQLGHCLSRASQLSLTGARSSGGIWAPTIRHEGGRFYMCTTNVTGKGNFLVHTEDPRGAWSEPLWIDQPGIDPSLFFNEGKVYFSTALDGKLLQSELDPLTGKILSETQCIWSGTGAQYPEGPHLYRRGAFFYLVIAEGGTEYGHMVSVARSETPHGPFQPSPHNPALSHRSYFSPIQATGHADLIETPDGHWWAVFLGIRPNGHPPCHHLGRETFLAPVTWTSDGWPVIGNGGRVSLEAEAPSLTASPVARVPAKDDFEGPELGLVWNFIRTPSAETWSLSERASHLRLSCAKVSLDDSGSPAFVGRRQCDFDFEAATLLEFSPTQSGEEAGICVRMNERHHYELFVTRLADHCSVVFRRRIGDVVDVRSIAMMDGSTTHLWVKGNKDSYKFGISDADGHALEVGSGETRYLSSEVATGYTGVYVGMFATATGQESANRAYFDWFTYSSKSDD